MRKLKDNLKNKEFISNDIKNILLLLNKEMIKEYINKKLNCLHKWVGEELEQGNKPPGPPLFVNSYFVFYDDTNIGPNPLPTNLFVLFLSPSEHFIWRH